MDWSVAENALRIWVRTASGYPDGRIIWAEQGGARPVGDLITLRLGAIAPVGMLDEVVSETDLGRPAGEEIEQRVEGIREFSVTLQAYVDAATGVNTGRAVLSRCATALALPSVRAALEVAGISPFEIGPVQNVTLLNRTEFEGRALLEGRFYARETFSEFCGYIATVETLSYLGHPDLGTSAAIDIP